MTKQLKSNEKAASRYGYKISTQIHVWRAMKKMTQQQLSDITGVSKQTITMLEKNRYNPSLMVAQAIADGLGADIHDLFIVEKDTSI